MDRHAGQPVSSLGAPVADWFVVAAEVPADDSPVDDDPADGDPADDDAPVDVPAPSADGWLLER